MSDNKNSVVETSLKFIGEVLVVPGASLIADGKVKSGLLHAGAGILASTLLWKPLVLVAVANSLSLSLTGESLLASLSGSSSPRSNNLEDRVKEEIKNGLTVEEIQETLREDVEDIYLEATAGRSRDG